MLVARKRVALSPRRFCGVAFAVERFASIPWVKPSEMRVLFYVSKIVSSDAAEAHLTPFGPPPG